MNEELRQMVIETLRRGEELPAEWAPLLFPPSKRESELTYFGKEREEEIIAGTIAVPLQPVRTFGKSASETNEWHNMLIFGDNLQIMKTLSEMKSNGHLTNSDGTPGVRLVYIDPPFGTGDEYGSDEETAYSAKIQRT
jgi:site-specific DNA-methyltransferase (adenine-specific)/adenine-specific DNA-methyltransferase